MTRGEDHWKAIFSNGDKEKILNMDKHGDSAENIQLIFPTYTTFQIQIMIRDAKYQAKKKRKLQEKKRNE